MTSEEYAKLRVELRRLTERSHELINQYNEVAKEWERIHRQLAEAERALPKKLK
jgi:hypothetical protein